MPDALSEERNQDVQTSLDTSQRRLEFLLSSDFPHSRLYVDPWSRLLVRVPAIESRLEKMEQRLGSVEERDVLIQHLLQKWAKSVEWQLEEDTEPTSPWGSASAKAQRLIALAEESLDQAEQNFGNLELRLDLVMKVKIIFRELWLLARREGDKYLKQVANMLHDALKNAHAEELSREQITTVRGILGQVKSKVMTIEDAKKVHDALTSVGLEYMPAIKDSTRL